MFGVRESYSKSHDAGRISISFLRESARVNQICPDLFVYTDASLDFNDLFTVQVWVLEEQDPRTENGAASIV